MKPGPIALTRIPSPVLGHPAGHRAIREQHAVEIDVDDPSKLLHRDLQHRVRLVRVRSRHSRAPDARRGHEDVHRSEPLDAPPDHDVVGGLVGGVDLNWQRLLSRRVDLPRALRGGRQIDVGDADVRSLLRESQCAGPSNAASSAGYQLDLSLEPSSHVVAPLTHRLTPDCCRRSAHSSLRPLPLLVKSVDAALTCAQHADILSACPG